jgi:signal transduction histidine kinase
MFDYQNWNIDIDKRKISQVIRNLLSNALKYTNANGNEVSVRVDIKHLIGEPAILKIDVIDQGVGISEVIIIYTYLYTP